MSRKENRKDFIPFVVDSNALFRNFEEMMKELEKTFSVELSYKNRDEDFWLEFFGNKFPQVKKIVKKLEGKRICIVWLSLKDGDKKDILVRYQKLQVVLENQAGIYSPSCFGDWAHMYAFMQNSSEFPSIKSSSVAIIYFPIIIREIEATESIAEFLQENGIQRGVSLFMKDGSFLVLLEIKKKKVEKRIFKNFLNMKGVSAPGSMEELQNWNIELQEVYNYPPIN